MQHDIDHIYPSFFVLGAQKCGTSTIHNWLAQNPNLCLPEQKESHYFSNELNYKKGLKWYDGWFKGESNKIRVEVDPSYLFIKETASRMRETINSNIAFIIIIRDPILRAYSHYRMSVQRGLESLNFIDAITREKNRLEVDYDNISLLNHSYITRGKYNEQIKHYRTIFPDSKILFLKFNDLFTSKSRLIMYRNICHFISIHPEIKKINLDIQSRPASKSRFIWLSKLIHKNSWLKKNAQKAISSDMYRGRIVSFIDEANKMPDRAYVSFDKSILPDNILEWANKEIVQTSELTNLDLNEWLNN